MQFEDVEASWCVSNGDTSMVHSWVLLLHDHKPRYYTCIDTDNPAGAKFGQMLALKSAFAPLFAPWQSIV